MDDHAAGRKEERVLILVEDVRCEGVSHCARDQADVDEDDGRTVRSPFLVGDVAHRYSAVKFGLTSVKGLLGHVRGLLRDLLCLCALFQCW